MTRWPPSSWAAYLRTPLPWTLTACPMALSTVALCKPTSRKVFPQIKPVLLQAMAHRGRRLPLSREFRGLPYVSMDFKRRWSARIAACAEVRDQELRVMGIVGVALAVLVVMAVSQIQLPTTTSSPPMTNTEDIALNW